MRISENVVGEHTGSFREEINLSGLNSDLLIKVSTFNWNIFQSHLDDLLDPCDEGDHVTTQVRLRCSNSSIGTIISLWPPKQQKSRAVDITIISVMIWTHLDWKWNCDTLDLFTFERFIKLLGGWLTRPSQASERQRSLSFPFARTRFGSSICGNDYFSH